VRPAVPLLPEAVKDEPWREAPQDEPLVAGPHAEPLPVLFYPVRTSRRSLRSRRHQQGTPQSKRCAEA
jgi:hypothetical protein